MSPTGPSQIGPRLELKHIFEQGEVVRLMDWVRERFRPDPHASDPAKALIRVTSLYFDSPTRACYRERARHKQPKYRLRRYDGQGEAFLEEKLRLGDRVWKRRLLVPQAQLRAVTLGREPLSGELEWFRSRFRTLNLQPTILLDYQRRAFVSDGQARITFDSNITAARVDPTSCGFEAEGEACPLGEHVIVEVKGPEASPEQVQAALGMIDRNTSEYSKYSVGLEAVGLEQPAPASEPLA